MERQQKQDRDCLACLPPFAGMDADAIKESSYNRNEWIIMRWKEVSFLNEGNSHHQQARSDDPSAAAAGAPPQNRGVSLSITGFYWLALSRRSGQLSGVYVDEPSTPVQKITLSPDKSDTSAAPWSSDFVLV